MLLARYLTRLGFSPFQIGAIITGTLLGSAALTLTFGLQAYRSTLGRLLVAAAVLMTATGVAFASVTAFLPLLLIAVVGTLNPSSGDVSVFLPTEQAFIAEQVDQEHRTTTYAIYNLGGALAGAFGALMTGLPDRIARLGGWEPVTVDRFGFVFYALVGLVTIGLYRPLASRTTAPSPPEKVEQQPAEHAEQRRSPNRRRHALSFSRRIVIQLAVLFSIDSAGGGFVVTALLVVWLNLRFGLSSSATAAVFFGTGLLSAYSQLAAPALARRIGMVRTMAYTHIPANLMLIGAAFAPTGGIAIGLLLGRALFTEMDRPARQAFVMAVVPPSERAAAAGVANVPRSLASAATPLIAGVLLSASSFGWPLIIGGVTKLCYDIALLALHRNTPEAVTATTQPD